MTGREWAAYVERFHDESPGVTESVLGRALDAGGMNPYAWVADGLRSERVLDVGCGSGPMHEHVAGWVGVDASRAELLAGRGRAVPVVEARAEALPVRDGSVPAAMLVMSLMVVDDPAAVVAELVRVLGPSGAVYVLLPADRPLRGTDRVRYGALLAALGRTRMPFPQPDVVRDPCAVLEAGGFTVIDDERRRFTFRVACTADGESFVDSLYLPGVSTRRVRLARAVVRAWGVCDIGIPLRRLLARTGDRHAAPPPVDAARASSRAAQSSRASVVVA
ncbi:MAG: methyltransferase domain-containing protein [Actinomycetota bacterium]|nr:methyltransferase domain-containing protein [Actinomycetota bacterium]